MTLPAMRLQPGHTFDDRFDIVAALDRGRLGELYRVTDQGSGKPALLLLFREELAARPKFDEDLATLIPKLLSLDDSSIARVIHHKSIGPFPYIAYDLPEDLDLRAWLTREGGKLPAERARSIYRRLGEALAAIHRQGLVHGLLSPPYLRFSQGQPPRLLGVGLSQLLPTAPPLLPEAAEAGYLAPELARALRRQRLNEKPTPAADQWSLAALIYELLIGRPAFAESARAAESILDSVIGHDLLKYTLEGNRLQVLERGMYKQPHQRYRDIDALLRALDPETPDAPTQTEPAPPIQALQDPIQDRRLSRALLGILLAMAVVAAGVAYRLLSTGSSTPDSSPDLSGSPQKTHAVPDFASVRASDLAPPAPIQANPPAPAQAVPPPARPEPAPAPPPPPPPRKYRLVPEVQGPAGSSEEALLACARGHLKPRETAVFMRVNGQVSFDPGMTRAVQKEPLLDCLNQITGLPADKEFKLRLKREEIPQ